MKKSIYIPIIIVVLVSASIYGYNYFLIQSKMNDVLNEDSRNKGIEVSVHYEKYIPSSSTLIYDLTDISSSNSKADVFRVLLQFASKVKTENFSDVILAYKGANKFKLKGSYFKLLGEEYGTQNPIYTMRTFPENVMNMAGNKAFSSWTGGILGVAKEQIDDFNKFHDEWYIK